MTNRAIFPCASLGRTTCLPERDSPSRRGKVSLRALSAKAATERMAKRQNRNALRCFIVSSNDVSHCKIGRNSQRSFGAVKGITLVVVPKNLGKPELLSSSASMSGSARFQRSEIKCLLERQCWCRPYQKVLG